MSKLYIGCSGYSYPHWRNGLFYPEDLPQRQEFAYYASTFNTVELNNTFYRQPVESTWKKWSMQAPPGFIYSLKTIHFLTHENRLLNPKTFWEHFWEGAQRLRDHLGPILFQLPPEFPKNAERLEKLAAIIPDNLRIAIEFRNLSWFDNEVYGILKKHNWALVISSHPKLPVIPHLTADYTYFRFHGIPKIYRSDYAEDDLKKYAEIMKRFLDKGTDVYAYFNNTIGGYAPKNALKVRQYLTS